jgi:hypothetical protein
MDSNVLTDHEHLGEPVDPTAKKLAPRAISYGLHVLTAADADGG